MVPSHLQSPFDPIGIIGSGTMGRGIAQLAAANGHRVVIVDSKASALTDAKAAIESGLQRQVEKGTLDADRMKEAVKRLTFSSVLRDVHNSKLIYEAILEDLGAKRELISQLDNIVKDDCVIGTNTSSLSVTGIAAGSRRPERVVGIHFFNPAPLMPLVELVATLRTSPEILVKIEKLLQGWGKTSLVAKDTPGFIVNRVARPFYTEALHVLDEGMADSATIDWAMRECGGFRMGPFELMDFIGNDVNFAVTESIFRASFFETRFRPSLTQQRLVQAGFLGKKTGRGFYVHDNAASNPAPKESKPLGEAIVARIVAMLVNEAADVVMRKIASPAEIDLAVTKGLNYPKGILAWADEIGIDEICVRLERLYEEYREERYIPHLLLRRMAAKGDRFSGSASAS